MESANHTIVTYWLGRWPIVFGLLGSACLLIWLFPYIASMYCIEVGGRWLDRATVSSSTPDLRAMAKAKTYLETALRWQKDNVEAYRLLSRIYVHEERLTNAAEVLVHTTTLRSKNPLRWRELAQIYEALGLDEQAQAAWRAGGFLAQNFLATGEQARKAGRYEEAVRWYKRAVQIEFKEGDAWYFMGQAYESIEQWDNAMNAFQRSLDGTLRTIGKSDVYYKIGWLQSNKITPPDLTTALENLDVAVIQDQFSIAENIVKAHYQRGEVLLQLGFPEKALAEYEWVVARAPRNYGALVRSGTLYWKLAQDARRAEKALTTAIDVLPNTKWAYKVLAEIYLKTGRKAQAAQMYRQILLIDPQDESILKQLDMLTSSE